MNTRKNKETGGFIAISTVLIIAAVIVTISVSVTLTSISEVQTALAMRKKEEAVAFVESCVEDALLRINKTNSLPSTLVIPLGTCTITINSQVGSAWTFTVTGSLSGYTKSFQLQINRGSTITVTRWEEV